MDGLAFERGSNARAGPANAIRSRLGLALGLLVCGDLRSPRDLPTQRRRSCTRRPTDTEARRMVGQNLLDDARPTRVRERAGV